MGCVPSTCSHLACVRAPQEAQLLLPPLPGLGGQVRQVAEALQAGWAAFPAAIRDSFIQPAGLHSWEGVLASLAVTGGEAHPGAPAQDQGQGGDVLGQGSGRTRFDAMVLPYSALQVCDF